MQVIKDIKMVNMVNAGGTLYRADQRFDFTYSDTGAEGTLDAAGATRFLQKNSQMRRISDGVWDYSDDAGAANLSLDFSQEFAP